MMAGAAVFRRSGKWFKELLPALVLVLVIAGGFAYCTSQAAKPVPCKESCPFAPLTINRLMVAPTRIAPGDITTFTNGVCNTSQEAVSAQYTISAQREGVDPLSPGATVQLVPPTDSLRQTAIASFQPGCIGEQPIVTTSSAGSLPPGRWHLFAVVTVLGKTAGDVQRLNVTSNTFEILAP